METGNANGTTRHGFNGSGCKEGCVCVKGARIAMELDSPIGKEVDEDAIMAFFSGLCRPGEEDFGPNEVAEVARLIELIKIAKLPDTKNRGVDAIKIRYGSALKPLSNNHPTKLALFELIEYHLHGFAREIVFGASYWPSAIKRAYRDLRLTAGLAKLNRELIPA